MSIEFQNEKHSDNEIFKALNPVLSSWFKEKFGAFTEPQRFGLLNIHFKKNTLISAPTGTGKTLTAFAGILSELINLNDARQLEDRVYCMYVSPLRALNNDIQRNLLEPLIAIKEKLKKEGKNLDIRIAVRTGDTPLNERQKQLRKPPHILITTPESFAILLNSPKFIENIKKTEWLIVDEIHALADNKRGVHLSLSMERLQKINPKLCRIGLSATISPLEEIARFLVGLEKGKERDCKIVDVRFIKSLDLKVLSPLPDLINTTQKEIQDSLYNKLDELIQKHKTTLIFTNTRSGTERVVDHLKERFSKKYLSNIGAHHSSVSRTKRLSIEERLKQGKLKVVVSSTSLELGIDIGYIDLVILLGSPKSISRALQRVGRSGHKLHDVIKGRIIVLDRDDLIECSVLLKNAKENNLDKIKVIENALDVLAQQIYGIAINETIHEKELFELIRKSYCYRNLDWLDFQKVLDYLSGAHIELERRHVYAKIWYDKETAFIGRKGKLARLLYMTNIGTIPDEAKIEVKIGNETIGFIDELFLERLNKGDVFVLGGEKYVYKYARGMTIQVQHEEKRPPTIPSWTSEMLPLSFDLALEIQKFRKLMNEKFEKKKKKQEIIAFINSYLYCDKNAAEAIYNYFREQYLYSVIPHESMLLIEQIKSQDENTLIFHSLYGRRVNDVLSRVLAFIISKLIHRDVMVSINDNGFLISSDRKMPLEQALNLLKKEDLKTLARMSIEDSEVLRRRFRHCATRALMILRSYKGKTKSVGRQYMNSRLILSTVKEIDNEFPVLKEARREVLEDLMDLSSAEKVIQWLKEGKIKTIVKQHEIPSPFAFNIYAMGRSDIIKIESRIEFIKRLHEQIKEKIKEKNYED